MGPDLPRHPIKNNLSPALSCLSGPAPQPPSWELVSGSCHSGYRLMGTEAARDLCSHSVGWGLRRPQTCSQPSTQHSHTSAMTCQDLPPPDHGFRDVDNHRLGLAPSVPGPAWLRGDGAGPSETSRARLVADTHLQNKGPGHGQTAQVAGGQARQTEEGVCWALGRRALSHWAGLVTVSLGPTALPRPPGFHLFSLEQGAKLGDRPQDHPRVRHQFTPRSP